MSNIFGLDEDQPVERDPDVKDLPDGVDALEDIASEDLDVIEEQIAEEEDTRDFHGEGAFIEREDAVEDEEVEEEEVEDEDEYDAMLARALSRAREGEIVEEASEEGDDKDFRLGMELGRQSSEVNAKLAAVEKELEELKQARKEPEPEEVDPRDVPIDMSDPRVIQEIENRKDDPVELAKFMKAVADHEARRLVRAEMGPLKEQADKSKEAAEANALRAQLGAEVSAGLQTAFEMGGLERSIVKEYADNGENSLIVEYLKANPKTPLTARGILSAVMTIARGVERSQEIAQEQEDDSPKPKLVSKNRPTVASQRGRKVIKRQKARKGGGSDKSPEDEIRASIVGAKPASQRLDFMK